MATLQIDSESVSNNDEFLFSAAKRFVSLEDRVNVLEYENLDLQAELDEEMVKIAEKVSKIDPVSFVGIVSKMALSCRPSVHDLASNLIYDRIESQSIEAAKQFIRFQVQSEN